MDFYPHVTYAASARPPDSFMGDDAPSISRLRLMPDQPVEGCELTPDVFLTNGVPLHAARMEYHWFRSTEKMACSWCGKTPVTMQRLTDNSYYCSVGCFVAAWPGHTAQHRTGLTQKGPRQESAEPTDGWSLEEGSALQPSTEQKWVEVSDLQSYTPSMDDVGHMLKLVRQRGAGTRSAVGQHAPPLSRAWGPRPGGRRAYPLVPTARGAVWPRRSRRPTSSRRLCRRRRAACCSCATTW